MSKDQKIQLLVACLEENETRLHRLEHEMGETLRTNVKTILRDVAAMSWPVRKHL